MDRNTKKSADSTNSEKIYNKIKIRISVVDIVLNLLLIGIFAFSGISNYLVLAISSEVANVYLQYFLFITALGVLFSFVGLPLDFYSSFILEHRFGLSNQTFLKWIYEKVKSSLVGLTIGIPVAFVFFFFLKMSGFLWWLYFSLFIIFITVVLARLAPVLILPIFYKFQKIENEEIETVIYDLLKEQSIDIEGIFTFNMSKDTKKANAGFTGIGKSKRIILSDTLVEDFTPQEIAVIFAHEMGHYKMKHILKNLILSSAVILLSFFLCGAVYEWNLKLFGFRNVYEIAAIPILFFYLSIFGIIIMPITNAISRGYERKADRYALVATGDVESFVSSMEKLAEINLSDKDPHPFTEFFFYSHPAIKKRIAFAEGFNN